MKTVNKVTIYLTIESGKKTKLNVCAEVRGNEDRLIKIKGFKKPVGELAYDLAHKIESILLGW